jgi:type IV pilus assembly protein PilA
MKKISGFTLIELMIVVAIIGVLAAIAVPQFQDYVTRSRWQDAVTVIASSKNATAECIHKASGDPTQCDTDGKLQSELGGSVALPGSAVGGAVTITRGTFTPGVGGIGGIATFILASSGALMGSCTVTLVGTVMQDRISWTFENSGVGCTRVKTGVGT